VNQQRHARRLLLCLTLVTLGTLAAACGGGSDDAADQRLHAALLSPDDLTVGTWVVAEDDNFAYAEKSISDPVCDGLKAVFARRADDATTRAERRLEAQPGPAVEVQLSAFEDDSAAEDVLADVRALSDDDTAACFAVTLKSVLDDPAAVVTLSTPSTEAPSGGVAYADDRDRVVAGGSRALVHFEDYTWTEGNIAVSVEVYALKSVDVTPLVAAILDKLSTSVGAALRTD
jgi:hypothetical protein